jgi:SAM-dependent methyltransferase
MSKPFNLADEASKGFSNAAGYDQHRPSKVSVQSPFVLPLTPFSHCSFTKLYSDHRNLKFLFSQRKSQNEYCGLKFVSGYPREAVDKLLNLLGVANQSQARIVDLASGTGKFTELLVARPEKFEVVAVEPHEGMRGTLEKKNLGIEILDGNAGNMPVKDDWGDSLIAAQVGLAPWGDLVIAADRIERRFIGLLQRNR